MTHSRRLGVMLMVVACAAPAAAQDTPPPAESEADAPAADPAAIGGEVASPEAPGVAEADASMAADAAAAAQAAADDALVAAELSRLGLTDAQGEAADTWLKLSGFADFGVFAVFGGKDWRGAYERYPAFAIGNFNLYLDAQVAETLRMFGEVRFTFLPNGSAPPGSAPGEYERTATEDYANFKRPIRWAGIYIPRVYLEWAPLRALSFRAGVFLTPYGIWNVDHGTPTVIPAQRPFIIGQALFPEQQTGIQASGQFDVGSNHTLGYCLTLSNGLGPVSEYRDFDSNKAVGGRVYWAFDGLGQLRVGGSAFYGTDTAAHEVASLDPDGKHVSFRQEIDFKSDVLGLAADIQWKYRGFLIQTELVTQQRRFDEKGRIGAVNPFLGTYQAPSDKLSWGVYALSGYRFEWFGVMPYVLFQTMDATDLQASVRYLVHSVFAGLNIRPIDVLVIKLEYSQSHFPNGFVIKDDVRLGQIQIAMAF